MGRPLFILLILFFFTTCEEENSPQRPNELWARRSVLDQRPRMLSLALAADRYIAYDVEKCGLYKFWQGGIYWDGAAYNNIKTVQPTSWGTAYWEEKAEEEVWWIEREGAKQTLSAQSKGYIIQDNVITLRYQLSLTDGTLIEIKEEPDIHSLPNNKVALYRDIYVEGLPAGAQLFYQGFSLRANNKTRLEQLFEAIPTPIPSARLASANSSQYWLDRSGCNTCHRTDQQTIGPSYRAIAGRYENQAKDIAQLTQKIKTGGSGVWGEVMMPPHPQLGNQDIKNMLKYILSLKPAAQTTKGKPRKKKAESNTQKQAGFGAALTAVHPSFDVQTIRPSWFKPRVGAMDFHPDGRLLLTSWDSIGALYALSGVESGDTNQIQIQQIAMGLSEPLGMKVVDEDIFVLQKQELSQLIDLDQDGKIDEYRTICDAFGVRPDFHEYSYGLVYKEGFFYANLGLAMRLMSHETQLPDRGTSIKIALDGSYETIATGLRQANGLGLGPEGEIFITENQGQWAPACKIIHLEKDHFYGCEYQTGDRYKGQSMSPPAVWLPHHEIGNSPGQIVQVGEGIYQGQMLHGEVTHGGIKRVFLEKIKGEYQGAVFRFSQGLEAGINRMVWGPDGALYVGGVGMNGNWGWNGRQFGLQKLVPTGKVPFEMLAVRALADGLEIEFTAPLAEGQGEQASDYHIEQWRYETTPMYGGPKLDLADLTIKKISLSPDRKKVRLTVPDCREGFVIYLLLNEELRSEQGDALWSGEAWYTLNQKR